MKAQTRTARRRMLLIVLLLVGFTAALHAATVYVQNSRAVLLERPAMNATGAPLRAGQPLTVIGEEGIFLRVRSGQGATGWIPRLFVSAYAPGKRLNLGTAIDKSTSVKARARASNYSQTAAARGLTKSQKLRARGRAEEYDFDAVDWLERISIHRAEVDAFIQAGGLRED